MKDANYYRYYVVPCGQEYGVYNALGEIVYYGGLLECHEVADRYRARGGELIRGRKPYGK